MLLTVQFSLQTLIMHKLFISCAVGLLAIGPALASDETDVMAVVHKWGNAVVATCADEASVIDSIPPYEWHGSGACSKWQKEDDDFSKQNGLTDGHAVVGKAQQIDISGDHAFVIAPVTYFAKQGGKDVQQLATGTFALQKRAGGWRITGWAYSPR